MRLKETTDGRVDKIVTPAAEQPIRGTARASEHDAMCRTVSCAVALPFNPSVIYLSRVCVGWEGGSQKAQPSACFFADIDNAPEAQIEHTTGARDTIDGARRTRDI